MCIGFCRENGLQMLWILQNKKGKTYIKLNIFIERYHDDKGENNANKVKRTPKDRVKNTERN